MGSGNFWGIVNELTLMLLSVDAGDTIIHFIGDELLNITP